MVKICLYCARYQDESFKVAPLGIGYLYSYLVSQGIVDKDNILIVDSFEEILEFKPNIVAVSSVSHVINDAIKIAKQSKKSIDCLTVLGGYHISCVPNALPEEFDIGVLGEGELTFAEIVKFYSPLDRRISSIENIKGLCYRDKGDIRINPLRGLIEDINLLPWPFRHKKYSSDEAIFTSRGCPYKCTFCASHGFWNGKVRFRSAESVVDEISYIVETHNPKEIAILDDLWIADKKRFRAIVDGLIQRNIPRKVTFRGFCRSSIVDEQTILLLKKINYRVLRFGGETGSDELLKSIKGNDISVSDHQRVIDLAYKHGMECGASFMFGVPGETKEDIKKTIQFLEYNKRKLKIIGFYLFNPIPGTIIWRQLEEKNFFTSEFKFENLQLDISGEKFDWEKLLYFNNDKIPLKEFRPLIEEIKKKYYVKSKAGIILSNVKFKLRKMFFASFLFVLVL